MKIFQSSELPAPMSIMRATSEANNLSAQVMAFDKYTKEMDVVSEDGCLPSATVGTAFIFLLFVQCFNILEYSSHKWWTFSSLILARLYSIYLQPHF